MFMPAGFKGIVDIIDHSIRYELLPWKLAPNLAGRLSANVGTNLFSYSLAGAQKHLKSAVWKQQALDKQV